MYVVVMWNQAGGSPVVADTTIYEDEGDAIEMAKDMNAMAAPRKDRYTVYELDGSPTWLEYEEDDDLEEAQS